MVPVREHRKKLYCVRGRVTTAPEWHLTPSPVAGENHSLCGGLEIRSNGI